jgi:hypothetical protein
MAKIEKIELRMVDLPPKVKRTDAIQSFVSQETPIVTITDSDGAVGTGYSYTIGTGGSSVMRLLSDHLVPILIGTKMPTASKRSGTRWNSLRMRRPSGPSRRWPLRPSTRTVGSAGQETEPAAMETRRRRKGSLPALYHRGRLAPHRKGGTCRGRFAGQGEGFFRLQGQDRQAAWRGRL